MTVDRDIHSTPYSLHWVDDDQKQDIGSACQQGTTSTASQFAWWWDNWSPPIHRYDAELRSSNGSYVAARSRESIVYERPVRPRLARAQHTARSTTSAANCSMRDPGLVVAIDCRDTDRGGPWPTAAAAAPDRGRRGMLGRRRAGGYLESGVVMFWLPERNTCPLPSVTV